MTEKEAKSLWWETIEFVNLGVTSSSLLWSGSVIGRMIASATISLFVAWSVSRALERLMETGNKPSVRR